MVHGFTESIKKNCETVAISFKIEWVTVSATFCTATSKVVNGPLPKFVWPTKAPTSRTF